MKASQLLPRDDGSPGFIRNCFRNLREATAGELQTVVDWFETGGANLSLDDCVEALTKFAEERGTPVSKPATILKSLFALEAWRADLNINPAMVLRFLEDDARTQSKPQTGEIVDGGAELKTSRDLLLRFFGDSSRLRLLAKAQRLYDGVVPSFESCCSAVEFRPVFNQERTQFENGVIMATLIIRVRENGEYGGFDEHSIHLDAADIDELIKELESLKTEFSVLKRVSSSQVRLLNPSQSFTP